MAYTTPLLPCYAKDAAAELRPNSDHNLHPIGKLLRGRRIAQAALGMSIGLAISTAWFRYDGVVLSPKIVSVTIAAVLSAAAAVIWNVGLVARVVPGIAVAVERAGLAALMFPFFAVVDAFVGKKTGDVVGWVPWVCLVWTVMVVTGVRVARPQDG
ncbi:hypothetical protein V2J09_012905 [Rumex salicifolius]